MGGVDGQDTGFVGVRTDERGVSADDGNSALPRRIHLTLAREQPVINFESKTLIMTYVQFC